MATREARDDVRKLLGTYIAGTTESESNLDNGLADQCIATGARLVDDEPRLNVLSEAARNDIKRYLAAHFAALVLERGAIAAETIGNVTQTYNFAYGEGLKMTRFGMVAITLDTTGVLLASTTITNKAEFKVI